eukprot:3400918-Amphidinium_carterae.1
MMHFDMLCPGSVCLDCVHKTHVSPNADMLKPSQTCDFDGMGAYSTNYEPRVICMLRSTILTTLEGLNLHPVSNQQRGFKAQAAKHRDPTASRKLNIAGSLYFVHAFCTHRAWLATTAEEQSRKHRQAQVDEVKS